MAVNFAKTFGAASTSGGKAAASETRAELPKAKIWLNVGYLIEGVPTTDGTGVEDRFVSLPVGIPLDTMEKVPTNSRNAAYAQFQAARNSLHDQLMEIANTLEAGEDKIFGLEGGLAIQIRHVAAERENVIADENNPFAIKLVFA